VKQPGSDEGAETLDPETEIDGLFRAPLAEFISVRTALHARFKPLDPAVAARIKALAKPSVSAWAVNQLYWREPALYQRLIEAGAAMHAMTGGDADGLRSAMATRRAALDEAVRSCGSMLAEAGHGTSMSTMRRVALTLEALAAHGGSDPDKRAGRLSADVDPPAIDRLAALASMAAVPERAASPPPEPAVDAATPRGPRLVPPPVSPPAPPRDRERERAREALTEAEGDLQVLTHEANRAREARTATAERLASLDARVEEARASLAVLEDKLAAAQREARDARASERRAETAEARAQQRAERARTRLDEL
jgi:hypothetical protein